MECWRRSKIVGLSAGDEYGIFGMDLGMGARTAQACEEKLNSMDGASYRELTEEERNRLYADCGLKEK